MNFSLPPYDSPDLMIWLCLEARLGDSIVSQRRLSRHFTSPSLPSAYAGTGFRRRSLIKPKIFWNTLPGQLASDLSARSWRSRPCLVWPWSATSRRAPGRAPTGAPSPCRSAADQHPLRYCRRRPHRLLHHRTKGRRRRQPGWVPVGGGIKLAEHLNSGLDNSYHFRLWLKADSNTD